nr:hypothetical protein [Tanacetum cinerariifolium]
MEVDIDNTIINEYLMCDAKNRNLNYFCGVDINTLTIEEYMDLRLYVVSKRRFIYKRIKDKKMSWILFYVLMDKIDAIILQSCTKFNSISHQSSEEVEIESMNLEISFLVLGYCVTLLIFQVIIEVDIDNTTINEYLMCDAKNRNLNYFCGVDINTLTMEEYMDLRLYVVSKRRFIYKRIKDKKMSWILFDVLMDKIDAIILQSCTKFNSISHQSSEEVEIESMNLESAS